MPTIPNCCEIEALLQSAWADVLAERPPISKFLRNGADHDAYERAVAFRIGLHLAHRVETARRAWPWPTMTVDMELQRKTGGDPKLPNAARPDLIIHVRGNDDANLLVAEFKVSSNLDADEVKKDRRTIYSLVAEPLRYRHGVRGVFDVESEVLSLIDWLHRDSPVACAKHPGFVGTKDQYVDREPVG